MVIRAMMASVKCVIHRRNIIVMMAVYYSITRLARTVWYAIHTVVDFKQQAVVVLPVMVFHHKLMPREDPMVMPQVMDLCLMNKAAPIKFMPQQNIMALAAAVVMPMPAQLIWTVFFRM